MGNLNELSFSAFSYGSVFFILAFKILSSGLYASFELHDYKDRS